MFSGKAEGWAGSERDVGHCYARGRRGAVLLAGAEDAAPAANVAGLRLHAAPLHRLPAGVRLPQLPEGNGEFYGPDDVCLPTLKDLGGI